MPGLRLPAIHRPKLVRQSAIWFKLSFAACYQWFDLAYRQTETHPKLHGLLKKGLLKCISVVDLS